MQITLNHLKYADINQWQQTREIMHSVLLPYLKNKDTTPKDILPLPIDDVHAHVPDTTVKNEDVEWYKNYVENYKKEHQA